MGTATLLCIAALIFVMLNVDPFQSGFVGFAFFYTSLLFSLVGIFSLSLFALYRRYSSKHQPLFRYVQTSFQEAVLLSVFLCLAAYLQAKNWLHSFNGALLALLYLSVLTLTIAKKKQEFTKTNHNSEETV